MRIVVLMKEVPDTYGNRVLSLTTGLAERGASEAVLDEITERALEVALAHRDAHPDAEVVVLSMAPESAGVSLRKALAAGADRAVQVVDPALRGADLTLTAEVLAAAVARLDADLVIAGSLSTDGAGGVLPAMLAELWGAAQATGLDVVRIDGARVSGTRASDGGVAEVTAELPAVISVTERLPELRLGNFKSILAAKKKTLETLALADLGIVPENPDAARSIVISVAERPARQAGRTIADDGTAAAQLADFLIAGRLV